MAADGTATGSGRNGALTAALLKHLGTPGQTLEHMATRVVREVKESTADQAPDGSRRQQTPEYVSSLTVHGLCLVPAAAQPHPEPEPVGALGPVPALAAPMPKSKPLNEPGSWD